MGSDGDGSVPASTARSGATLRAHDDDDSEQQAKRLLGVELIERYVIDDIVGVGGMATVYLGRHLKILKPVAIKVLSRADSLNRVTAKRFLTEAQMASKLRHEHIVDINDFGETPDGCPFYVMEYLEGEDLAELIRREAPLSLARTLAIIDQVLDALGAAHAAGVIHRDMKPQNCFRVSRKESDDFVKVLDFGIAKVASSDSATATSTGVLLGTPAYMAPEQAEQADVDARTDLYAVGTMLFEMLTGQRPFPKAPPLALLTRKLHEDAPRARSVLPSVEPWIEELIAQLLSRDPNARPSSVAVVRGVLDERGRTLVPATPQKAGRPWLAPAVGAVALAAAVGIWQLGTDTDEAEAEANAPVVAAAPEPEPEPEPAPEPARPPDEEPPAAAAVPEAQEPDDPLPDPDAKEAEPQEPEQEHEAEVEEEAPTADRAAVPEVREQSIAEIRREIRRKAGAATKKCGALATHEREVRVTVAVAPTGTVDATVHPPGNLGPAFARCVEKAVEKVKLAPGPRKRRLDVTLPIF